MFTKIHRYISPRTYFLTLFSGCVVILGFGLYLEHALALEPCPLCILQRIAYISVALISLVAGIHRPRQGMVYGYNAMIALAALVGAIIAGRQIWLQHLPADQVPECGPGLEYMLTVFPMKEALKMILSGSGECAEVQWRFIGLSIPEWSLLCFIAVISIAIYSCFYLRPDKYLKV